MKSNKKRYLALVLCMLLLIASPVLEIENSGCGIKAAKTVSGIDGTSWIAYICISESYLELNSGQTEKLSYTIIPEDADEVPVMWKTSNSSVVTVDQNGRITARKPGRAIITVYTEDESIYDTCEVWVMEVEAEGLKLAKSSTTVIIGKPVKVKATVYPSNTTYKKITWRSNKKSVATVSSDGTIKGVSYGKAKITASINGITRACTVIVTGKNSTKRYSGGAIYKGQLGNGKRNGKGTLKRANGTRIKGVWSNDKLLSNKACVTFKNGDVYKGCYTNYKKTGRGVYTKKNGTVIKGIWKKNKLTGKADIKYNDGDKFTGYFKADKKNGKGTYKFANGDTYKGNWKNDKMNGKGKYTFKNGAYYQGTFKNNKLTGTGYYKAYKGKLYKGTFKNGTMVKVISVK